MTIGRRFDRNAARGTFRDAPRLLRSKDPILVTRRGRLTGVFSHGLKSTLSVEFKRELFPVLSTEVERQIKKRGVTESKCGRISNHGGRCDVRLVADANLLLSAVLGGRAELRETRDESLDLDDVTCACVNLLQPVRLPYVFQVSRTDVPPFRE